MPVLTDLSPAPDKLLKMIRCNCHTDCSSMRCTCKKYKVKCSSVCGNCKGTTQIPQSMKKMIQIPTLNESETYHLYTQENRFPLPRPWLTCVIVYVPNLTCTMSGLEL